MSHQIGADSPSTHRLQPGLAIFADFTDRPSGQLQRQLGAEPGAPAEGAAFAQKRGEAIGSRGTSSLRKALASNAGVRRSTTLRAGARRTSSWSARVKPRLIGPYGDHCVRKGHSWRRLIEQAASPHNNLATIARCNQEIASMNELAFYGHAIPMASLGFCPVNGGRLQARKSRHIIPLSIPNRLTVTQRLPSQVFQVASLERPMTKPPFLPPLQRQLPRGGRPPQDQRALLEEPAAAPLRSRHARAGGR